MRRDSVGHTIVVAVLLCVVCSVLVSGAAVGLRERQQANRERERKLNILTAAGLTAEADRYGVDQVFDERVVEKVVELETGLVTDDLNPASYDPRQAARDPQQSVQVPPQIDAARSADANGTRLSISLPATPVGPSRSCCRSAGMDSGRPCGDSSRSMPGRYRPVPRRSKSAA